MKLGPQAARRSTEVNSAGARSRKPGGPRRRKSLLLALTAVAVSATSLLALQAVAGQAAKAAVPPVVAIVSPNSGPATGGTSVSVFGNFFTGATSVLFGSTPGINLQVVSDGEVTVTAPAESAGTVDVFVTTPDGTNAATSSDHYTYTAVAPPVTVTGVSPSSGPTGGGNTVTVTGTGFVNAHTVSFGSNVAHPVEVQSDSKLITVAPAGAAGTVDVTVSTASGVASPISAADQYTYAAPTTAPAVSRVDPVSGPAAGGNEIAIDGSSFSGATSVLFGSAPASSFTVNSDARIFAFVPAGAAGTVDITVTTPAGTSATSAADQYTYLASAPTVTAVSPSSGTTAGGTTVTVTGTGFTGATAVQFGSGQAHFTVTSDTEISAVTPAGTGTVDVVVTTPAGTSPASTADQYTYQTGTTTSTCTTTITGTHAAQLTVTSGLTCLVNATQNGQVTVAAGAALSATNSTILGTVTATSPSGITYCKVTENGTLSVTGSTGPVILGGTLADGIACAADTIPSAVTITGATAPVTVTGLKQNGTLTLGNDSAGVTLDGSQLNGLAFVENNATAVTVAGNTVTGSLTCTGNNPAPVDNGSINTVSGTASGQCASIAKR